MGSSAPPPPEDALEPGSRVGRYVVLRRLARGGMGVVYMAYDEELDRRVALKLLATSDAPAPERTERLLREAQAMAKLAHPNVVSVFDVGTVGLDRERVFLAMEYVAGPSLRAWRRADPRSAGAVVSMYLQAGRGLEAAHASGVVHRDFKPDNVVVDERGRARVLDFGLAWIEPPATTLDASGGLAAPLSAGGRPPLTRVGDVLGTPEYMAPEQLEGDRGDARSDVFAFSVALYEALYGERPYAGDTTRELLAAIVAERGRPATSGARVPGAVRAALLRGLRARPEDRWPGLRPMLDALEAALSRKRMRLLAGVAAVACVGLLAAFAPRAERLPVCAGADRESAEAWGDAQREAVRRAFSASGNPRWEGAFRRVAGTLDAYATAWANMRTGACRATRVEHAQPDLVLDLRTACLDERRRELVATVDVLTKADAKLVDDGVRFARSLGDLAECADVESLRAPYATPHDPAARRAALHMRDQVATATALANASRYAGVQELVGPLLLEARETKNRQVEAQALVLQGRAALSLDVTPSTDPLLDAALEASAIGDDLTEADAWLWLVRTAGFELAHFEESQEYARLAKSAIERAGNVAVLRARLAQNQGHAYLVFGAMAEAAASYRDAIKLDEQVFGAESPEAASVESDLAQVTSLLGHAKEAIVLQRQALRKITLAFGDDSPKTSVPLSSMADDSQGTGDFAEAVRLAHRADAVAATAKVRLVARVVEACALVGQGDVAGGIAKYTAAKEAFADLLDPSESNNFALALLRRHRTPEALRYFEEALRQLSGADADKDVRLAAVQGRALCLARSGHAREALDAATAAVAEEETFHSGEPLDLAYLALGEAALAAGDATRALAALERGVAGASDDDVNPELHADLHLALARALDAARSNGPRARTLAAQAAAEYEASHLDALATEARALAAKPGGAPR